MPSPTPSVPCLILPHEHAAQMQKVKSQKPSPECHLRTICMCLLPWLGMCRRRCWRTAPGSQGTCPSVCCQPASGHHCSTSGRQHGRVGMRGCGRHNVLVIVTVRLKLCQALHSALAHRGSMCHTTTAMWGHSMLNERVASQANAHHAGTWAVRRVVLPPAVESTAVTAASHLNTS